MSDLPRRPGAEASWDVAVLRRPSLCVAAGTVMASSLERIGSAASVPVRSLVGGGGVAASDEYAAERLAGLLFELGRVEEALLLLGVRADAGGRRLSAGRPVERRDRWSVGADRGAARSSLRGQIDLHGRHAGAGLGREALHALGTVGALGVG